MKRMTEERINEARGLRSSGSTYSEISKQMGLAKSTLHYWLSEVSRPESYVKKTREEWMTIVQPMGALANKKKRADSLVELQKAIDDELEAVNFDLTSKKAMLAMLYWAEGAKGEHSSLVFANTDPRLMRLFVMLLRQCHKLDESKFRVRIFLHHYHKEDEVKDYWSKLLSIGKDQFQKTYWKKRGTNKTYRRNSWGICFLIYHNVALKDELLKYGVKIGEMIK